MSRLWPETLVIGVFPGACVVRRGKATVRRACSAGAGYEGALSELGLLLDELRAGLSRFVRAEVYVSDGFGRIALLPWQSKLDSDVQVQAYGQACLESNGALADGDWAVHSGFRHYGAHGLAAALPTALVEQLREILHARRVRLESVMPLAAAAYWYHRTAESKSTSVLLLAESSRLTAFYYAKGRLQFMDVEPIPKKSGAATQRLFNRLLLSDAEIKRVDHWSANPEPAALEAVKVAFEGAVVAPLERARWSIG